MTITRNLLCITGLCIAFTLSPGCHQEEPPKDLLETNLGNESLILLPVSMASYDNSDLPSGRAEIIELGESVPPPAEPVEEGTQPESPAEGGSKWERLLNKAAQELEKEAGDENQPSSEAPEAEEEPER